MYMGPQLQIEVSSREITHMMNILGKRFDMFPEHTRTPLPWMKVFIQNDRDAMEELFKELPPNISDERKGIPLKNDEGDLSVVSVTGVTVGFEYDTSRTEFHAVVTIPGISGITLGDFIDTAVDEGINYDIQYRPDRSVPWKFIRGSSWSIRPSPSYQLIRWGQQYAVFSNVDGVNIVEDWG